MKEAMGERGWVNLPWLSPSSRDPWPTLLPHPLQTLNSLVLLSLLSTVPGTFWVLSWDQARVSDLFVHLGWKLCLGSKDSLTDWCSGTAIADLCLDTWCCQPAMTSLYWLSNYPLWLLHKLILPLQTLLHNLSLEVKSLWWEIHRFSPSNLNKALIHSQWIDTSFLKLLPLCPEFHRFPKEHSFCYSFLSAPSSRSPRGFDQQQYLNIYDSLFVWRGVVEYSYVHLQRGRCQRSTSGAFLYHFLPYFLIYHLSVNMEPTDSSRLTGLSRDSSISASSVLGWQVQDTIPSFLPASWASKPRSSFLCQKDFINQAISSAPQTHYSYNFKVKQTHFPQPPPVLSHRESMAPLFTFTCQSAYHLRGWC